MASCVIWPQILWSKSIPKPVPTLLSAVRLSSPHEDHLKRYVCSIPYQPSSQLTAQEVTYIPQCLTALQIYCLSLQMYEYYDQYVKANGDPDAQERWARQLIWEVARHAVGEELVIYPLMEKHLGEEGKKLADQDRADHQVRFCISTLSILVTYILL
jgi:hypothetical protein